jgi:dTDP-4-amino-4,6-dideoxygalactose transaminase
MVDLVGQYARIKPEVDQAVIGVLNSGVFIKGPEVQHFEEELAAYLGVKHVIACANGTDALQLAMMALGLQPGDEVITASFTYVATAEVIALLKLTPVLVDVHPDTFTIDPEALEKAITPRTKAIVPVHLFGQCANMDSIMDIAKKHHLFVIEDNAQAIGADYTFSNGTTQKGGTIGHIGCTSFFPSKNLGCYGDGGAMFTNDDELADKLKMIANHGQKVRYYHDVIGVNSRLDAIQAVILRIKLRHLNEYAAARQAAAAKYDAAFANHPQLQIPVRYGQSSHVFHQYTLRLRNGKRDDLIKALNEKGIPANVYYPVPLHQQKAYLDPRYKDGDFPISEQLSHEVFSLPMHTELSDEQIDFITSNVLALLS